MSISLFYTSLFLLQLKPGCYLKLQLQYLSFSLLIGNLLKTFRMVSLGPVSRRASRKDWASAAVCFQLQLPVTRWRLSRSPSSALTLCRELFPRRRSRSRRLWTCSPSHDIYILRRRYHLTLSEDGGDSFKLSRERTYRTNNVKVDAAALWSNNLLWSRIKHALRMSGSNLGLSNQYSSPLNIVFIEVKDLSKSWR